MKPFRSLAILFGFCAFGASAQTALTTYYVVPPTNGCDGVWAFGPDSALWSACTGPYTWIFDPIDCVDGSQWGQPIPLNVVGDTIIMDLCSQPCDFLFYGDTGLCVQCICGPLILSNGPSPDETSSLSIGPNPVPIGSPVLTLNTNDLGPHQVQVLDLAGRTLLQTAVQGSRAQLDLSGIPAGGYLLLVRDGRGHMTSHRFQVE